MTCPCCNCPLEDREQVDSHGPSPEDAVAVIVGEAPGATEAREGRPFVGQSGQLLRSVAQYVGLDMSKVYLTNVVKCHPPNNKLPKEAILHCLSSLNRELQPYFDADVPIATAGATATETLTGMKKIGQVRGRWQDEDNILPMWHPAYLLRSPQHFSEFVADMRKLARGKPLRLAEPIYNIKHDLRYLCTGLKDRNQCVVIDLETDSLDYQKGNILSIGIGVSPTQAYIVPMKYVYEQTIRQQLKYIFSLKNVKIVGHNFKFDMRFLRHQLGIDNVRVDYDTLTAHYILDENSPHGLKQLLSLYFDIDDYEAELVKKHLKRGDNYSKVPDEDLYQYNAFDVCYNFALWEVLERELKEEGLYEVPFLKPYMQLHTPLLESELHGVLIDREAFKPLQTKIHLVIDNLQEQLEDMCGTPFNPNSPKQVSKIMYDAFKMPIVRGRNFKERSTSSGARIAIMKKISPHSDAYHWLELYDELKKVEKMRSSYIDNLPKFVDSNDRVHPEFKVHGTVVGRLSASNPAIQTIPRPTSADVGGEQWGKSIRSLFIAPQGKLLVQADYSQAELRAAAACSGDPYLLDLYKNERDLHSEVARGIYGPNYTKENRSTTKNFMFSYLYGGTEYSFAKDSGMPLDKAREFVQQFNQLMPTLSMWRESQVELMHSQGYVTTFSGKRRRFPLITNANAEDARKAAIHFPVAGLAAEIMLHSIVALDIWIKKSEITESKILFTVHDSVIFEVVEEDVKEVAFWSGYIMEQIATQNAPTVKWKVDVEVGQSWGDLKEYKVDG